MAEGDIAMPLRRLRSPGILRTMRIDGWSMMLLPLLVFLAAAFLYPLLYMVFRSVPDLSLSNYARIFSTPVYLNVLFTTFKVSAIVTAACLLLGYPYAYMLTHARGTLLTILTIALFLPFWVSILLRTFSWLMLLQDTGIINRALLDWGAIEKPIPLARNLIGVAIAMVHILLPFMVLPVASVMRGVKSSYMEAASICGAAPARCFFKVYLPLTMPGVLAGAVLTFTLSLGFYITPTILGGARDTMIAQLIADQISKQVNFAFSSALAVVLILFTAALFAVLGLVLALGKRREREVGK